MSDANVVPLRDGVLPSGKRAESIVKMLRDLLDQAERGEIQALAWVAVDPGAQLTCNWQHEGNAFALVGGVARLLYRMNQRQD